MQPEWGNQALPSTHSNLGSHTLEPLQWQIVPGFKFKVSQSYPTNSLPGATTWFTSLNSATF
jgi:hypothetical protein